MKIVAILLLFSAAAKAQDEPRIPVIHTTVVITGTATEPAIDRRNREVFSETLFSRDDQVFHALAAGINAGQHEGGGKSVEIRRFGFNLDHGGVNGGLKVLVDDVQQNQTTQCHGQGYLGSLKSLSPELVQEVNIINGPFSAEYGDFSGLGVVHIRLRESFPEQLTARLQGGSYNSSRAFLSYSPLIHNADAFVSYEGANTDGPFQNPLGYRRDNLSANYTRHLNASNSLGFKFNGGLNRFQSSGQLPLDRIQAGLLDPFGFVDPTDGGRVRAGTTALYFRHDGKAGDVFKLDGFVGRSLFDLYSNFTFFLNDPVRGDAIQQHDSRLQEGMNAQYTRPHRLAGWQGLLTVGGNFHGNQINVGLYPRIGRQPLGVTTRADAHVTNAAGYLQENFSLLHDKVRIGAGVRFDEFRFDVADRVAPSLSGVAPAARSQPKLSLAYTPSQKLPVTLYANYGRGISTADARAVVRHPGNVRVATTDFFQFGTSHQIARFSLTNDVFLIDRSHEQVYLPDDGTFEFRGPSRAYGLESKASLQLTRVLSINGGITKVANAFYRGTAPRIYVDSAPHFTADAGLTLSGWRGWTGSLRMRAINHYRLDGEDAAIVASGHTVWDFGMSRRIRRGVEMNFTLDNMLSRRYYETQNYFESRLREEEQSRFRIHATPGYPITAMLGITFRLFGK